MFCVAFHFGQMGGGDVKMIGALSLWLPLAPLLIMPVGMSLVGGAITAAILIGHRFCRDRTGPEFLYGVAIAIAGLLALRELPFN